jgi:hypothetical protein
MSYVKEDYDGSLIHQRFAYKLAHKDIGNSPLGFLYITRGIMNVTDNLIDLEDKINNDFIYSDDALNFCWEIPNMNPIGAVFFQRLFVQEIANLLRKKTYGLFDVEVRGDDLMLKKSGMETFGKASVSITKVTENVALGHLGINISAGPKAPSFAFSLFLSEADTKSFAEKVKDIFENILKDCFIATTKVI